MQEVVLETTPELREPAAPRNMPGVPDDGGLQPLLAPQPEPQPAHRGGGDQRGEQPGQHHLRTAREGDGRGGQHHRVHGGRRQQERERGGRGDAPPDQTVRHRHRRALAPRQHHTRHPRDRHRQRGPLRQQPAEDPGRHERVDRPRQGRAQQQERQRLHGHGQTHRPPRLHRRLVQRPPDEHQQHTRRHRRAQQQQRPVPRQRTRRAGVRRPHSSAAAADGRMSVSCIPP